ADRLDEEPEILRRLRRGERVDHFETIRRRKDGALLNISVTISPVKDAQGRIIGASKIARDITERKRSEAALRESEARFRQLADSMPQMVWTARPDGYLDYYNERWYEFTGFERTIFGDANWERIVHPEDAGRCRDSWYEAVRTGEPYSIEYRLWDRHESRWRWFIGRALPARGEDGEIVKWFGTCTDIDEQKRIEDELRRANDDLQQFAYTASHDLQEPLRTVKIYSQLLTSRYRDKLDGAALEFCDFVRAGATRMEALVRDLLAYTQVTGAERPAQAVDANAVLKEVVANLGGAISESGASITSDPLPKLRVHSTHLRQLLQNLAGNAIKYRSTDRAPVIHVSAQQQAEMWRLSVQDNGIGIDPEYKEQIFGLFKRLHAGDEYSGTGIGLAICQRIVERYHGRIWVESKPGQGSTFFFTLPG
ncbi:MAG: PAS domain S-box protein, partial [Acidobacteriaceae bacterium]|nr:PAS domain S-box protein [Acidobacteriaceae bacterium]